MKAISICQPFPYLILSGEKTIETRSWATLYRGPLLIVSSKKNTPLSSINRGIYGIWDTKFFWGVPLRLYQFYEKNPYGTMHCVVDLIDCRLSSSDDCTYACVERMEKYAWIISSPRPVELREVKGRLRLFDVPDDQIIYKTIPPVPAPEKEQQP